MEIILLKSPDISRFSVLMGTLFKLHWPHTMLKHQNLNVLQLLLFLHKIQTPAYVFITIKLKKSNTKGKKLRIYNNINEQVWGFKPRKIFYCHKLTPQIKLFHYISLYSFSNMIQRGDLGTPVCLMHKKHLSINMMH